MRAISWSRIMELRLRQDVEVEGIEVEEIAGMTEALVEGLCWNESRLLGFLETMQRDYGWEDADLRYAVRRLTGERMKLADKVDLLVMSWIFEEARKAIQDRTAGLNRGEGEGYESMDG